MISIVITACAGQQARQLARLDAAATQTGQQKAGDNLPDYPTYCSDQMPAVVPKLDEPIDGTQKRWEIVRAHENARIEWCANVFYGGLQKQRRAGPT